MRRSIYGRSITADDRHHPRKSVVQIEDYVVDGTKGEAGDDQ